MSALKKSSNEIPPEPTTKEFLDIVRKSAYLWAKVGTLGRKSSNALPELMMTQPQQPPTNEEIIVNHHTKTIMDYSNLKSKTIFDFCEDEKLISDIIIISKEAFLRELESYSLLNAHTLIEYAERINDKALLNAVEQQYKKELKAENNE